MEKKFGVNIFGYIDGEFGLGEAVRLIIKSIEKAKIPFVLLNYDTSTSHRHNDLTYINFVKESPYLINLVLLGPTEARRVTNYFGIDLFKNKYNIFFLNWESENFPKEYIKNLNFYDEVWTPANYCKNVVEKSCLIPVDVICYPIETTIIENDDEEFNNFFDSKKFNFLFIFDYNSTLERKNTLNLIEAFRNAFKKNDNTVCLTIKTSRSTKFVKEKKSLIEKIGEYENIKIVEKIFDKNTLHKIIRGCDSYVSLHRSEGFGLTMAEAMYFGKPVIATGYSGNTEFMSNSNSFLVDYNICKVDSDIINYDKNTIWSNPNINHASELLKIVKENSVQVKKIGIEAKESILQNFSFDKIGGQIKFKLEKIFINYKQNPYKEELIYITSENEILTNELKTIKKSKLIRIILNVKLYFRNRKKNRIKKKFENQK